MKSVKAAADGQQCISPRTAAPLWLKTPMLFWLKKFIAFWLMPLPFCLTTIAVGWMLMRTPRRARFGRALVITGLGLLMLLSNKFVSQGLLRPLERKFPAMPEIAVGGHAPSALANCRYIVVLGGGHGYGEGVSPNNLLSASALSRVVEGVRLARALPESRLITTGPGAPGKVSHAAMLGQVAHALGIAADRIIRVEDVRDTEDEAQAVKRIVGDDAVALTTSAWHLPRAVALFEHAGIRTLPCPADFKSHPGDMIHWDDFLWEVSALERSSLAIRERIGYLWIWLRGRG